MSNLTPLLRTPLHDLHIEQGAKMVPFAGYDMPLHYPPPSNTFLEHEHTRRHAGLFDISHMGQIEIRGADTAPALEALLPSDLINLAPGRQKYALMTTAGGGIMEDLMVQNLADHFMLVVNAANKHADLAYLLRHLDGPTLTLRDDLALLALQGPSAAISLAELGHDLADMTFMAVRELSLGGVACVVSRSGYSGEDGFEISLPAAQARRVAELLLGLPAVVPIGLGARDSLRLEAGLCLHGQDITTDTTPSEAGLGWAIAPPRRHGGARAGGFPGADIILPQLPNHPNPAPITRRRVGFIPMLRRPVRNGDVFAQLQDQARQDVGTVTSGAWSPAIGIIAMGYVDIPHTAPGTELYAISGSRHKMGHVVKLPFTPPNFYR